VFLTQPVSYSIRQAYGPVFPALESAGYVTMRRIAPIQTDGENGVLVDKAIQFHRDLYRVLSEERRVPVDQAAAIREALMHSIEGRYLGSASCPMVPGLYMTLHATNADGSEFYFGDGLICLSCGEVAFDFQASPLRQGGVYNFRDYLNPNAFNALLAAACATFPEDAVLRAILPRR
jgi:hypothetical protein